MRAFLLSLFFAGLLGPAQAVSRDYSIERGGQRLDVDIHFTLPNSREPLVLNWVEFVAEALAGVYGRWPRDELRVEVKPIGVYTSDPVPWAQVNRGDPDTVTFYIDALASEEKLVNNWTAYHEFSHLLIPYRGWGDMWFSEGLASYYQNLLQARSGVFDERELWQRLHDGFIRGRNNRRPDLSLAQLSPRMRENRSYMRVYWSGAWYFFNADLELRKRSGGRQSLDTALEQLNRCCAEQAMTAESIARQLDRLTGQQLFLPLFRQVSGSRELPDFETLYEELGIGLRQGKVELREDHAGASLRRAFASG
jgi:hypothetical protein